MATKAIANARPGTERTRNNAQAPLGPPKTQYSVAIRIAYTSATTTVADSLALAAQAGATTRAANNVMAPIATDARIHARIASVSLAPLTRAFSYGLAGAAASDARSSKARGCWRGGEAIKRFIRRKNCSRGKVPSCALRASPQWWRSVSRTEPDHPYHRPRCCGSLLPTGQPRRSTRWA